MGDIVIAAGTTHAPSVPMLSRFADTEQASRFYAGLGKIRDAFEEAKPDVIIEISNDHWNAFYLDNVPSICVGLAEKHFGPVEDRFGIPQCWFPGHHDFAMELVDEGMDSDWDLSWSDSLVIDHGICIPLHYITPNMDVRVVPILVNNLREPMPKARRLHQLGALIHNVVSNRPAGERVALLGTGGLSHSPGDPGSGLNVEFDEWFLDEIEAARGDKLAEMSQSEMARGGTAAYELKNWITIMGALSDLQGEVVAYEPIGDIGHGAAIWRP